jgi:hypothetical protein
MNRQRLILVRHRSAFQVGGGFQGVSYQCGYGYKGDEYQMGYGFKGDNFQRGYGSDPPRFCVWRGKMFIRQRGAGGWGWFGKIAARALPFLTRGVKEVGKHALTTVTDQAVNSSMKFLDDVLDGENVLDSARSRLREGGDALRDSARAKTREGVLELARTAKKKLAQVGQRQQVGSGAKRKLKRLGGCGGGTRKKRAVKKRGGRKGRKAIQSRALEGEGRVKRIGFSKNKTNLPYRHIFL